MSVPLNQVGTEGRDYLGLQEDGRVGHIKPEVGHSVWGLNQNAGRKELFQQGWFCSHVLL